MLLFGYLFALLAAVAIKLMRRRKRRASRRITATHIYHPDPLPAVRCSPDRSGIARNLPGNVATPKPGEVMHVVPLDDLNYTEAHISGRRTIRYAVDPLAVTQPTSDLILQD